MITVRFGASIVRRPRHRELVANIRQRPMERV
jgi:hypothetical protein